MLRRALHWVYRGCGYAAAGFLAAIAVVTFAQIVMRQLGIPVETTEVAGFCLAASTFLALAYTFVNGGHVRLGLVAQFLPGRAGRLAELWCCAIGAAISGYMAWQMLLYTLETRQFGDLSPGFVAMPLWIPQTGVTFGLMVLTVALLEQATLILSGKPADYETNVDATPE